VEALVTYGTVPTAGVVLLGLAAAVCIVSGLVAILDWQGYEKKCYEFAVDFPGGGLTKRLGYKYFRAVAGWGALVFGVVLAAGVIVAATR